MPPIPSTLITFLLSPSVSFTVSNPRAAYRFEKSSSMLSLRYETRSHVDMVPTHDDFVKRSRAAGMFRGDGLPLHFSLHRNMEARVGATLPEES